jgi:Tol biopolymer transport system component
MQPSATSSSAPVARIGEFVGLSGASISPDGRQLVHTDWTTGDLAVRDLLTGESRRITNKGPWTQSVEFAEFFMRFSRDGRQLAYIWDRNGYELHVTDLEAGARSRFVYRNPPGRGEVLVYAWSDDGEYLAAVVPRSADSRQLRIALISASDGSVRGLMDLDGAPPPGIREMRGTRMSFSPDSRFLTYDLPAAGSQNRDVFVISLEGSERSIAVQHPAHDRLFDWTPDGTALLFWSDRNGSPGVWLQRMQSGKPSGSAVRLTDLEQGARPLGFASDGTYYVAVGQASQHEVFVASLDLDQGLLSAISAPAAEAPGPRSAPEWSPDGNSIAYLEQGTIVIRSLESGGERRLRPAILTAIFTVGTGERYLRWSPDGRYLLVPQNRTLFRIDVSSGETVPFVGADQLTDRRSRYGRWSPDGKAVFYTRQPGDNNGFAEIVRMDLETENKEVLHRAPFPGDYYESLELSPDGLWLAFSGVDAAPPPEYEATTLNVIPASGGPARLLLRISGQEWMKVVGWAPNSGEILFTRGDKLGGEASTTLWRISAIGGVPSSIETGVPVLHAIRFHPDGRRVAFDAGRRGAEIRALTVFFPRR